MKTPQVHLDQLIETDCPHTSYPPEKSSGADCLVCIREAFAVAMEDMRSECVRVTMSCAAFSREHSHGHPGPLLAADAADAIAACLTSISVLR